MTLFPRSCSAEISTLWHFRHPLQIQSPINVASFLRLLATGMASLISSAEVSDYCVSKFISLVRARDQFPPVTASGEGLSFWGFTSKLF